MDKKHLKHAGKRKPLGIGVGKLFKTNSSPDTQSVADDNIQQPLLEWSERNVLVGVLRNAAQLTVCLKHNFYHIPEKYISERNLPIKYIAIYQSKNFFGSDSGVRYYGEVESFKRVKRNTIHEIPKDSDEYYYIFYIKQWNTLPDAIKAKELGFVRIFTNYELMLNSREVPELMLSNKKEHELYNCIKKAIYTARYDKENKTAAFAWDDYGFAVDVDDIHLIRSGQLINIYSVYEFEDIPLTILGQIRRDIDRKL